MSVTTAVTNTERLARLALLATHNLKIALYVQANANLNKDTTVYTSVGEVTGPGYGAGGASLTGLSAAIMNDVAVLDAADMTWASSTITADAAMLYDASDGNKCLRVWTFGSTSSNNSTFTLTMPGPDSTHGLLRAA
jgi:hypothetical protein